MIRFAEFESRGPALAGITEARDGDFSRHRLESQGPEWRLLADAGVRSLQLISQVHGSTVLMAGDPHPGVTVLGQGDAIATDRTAVAMGIRVADCVPVFLYAPDRRCGALIHAGREGTRAGISGHAANVLIQVLKADPASMAALIGPSAGPCCYEVDEATAKRCSDNGLRVSGRRVDLWASNRDQLVNAGLRLGNIDVTRICTICSPVFHSYRRTAAQERNLAVLML